MKLNLLIILLTLLATASTGQSLYWSTSTNDKALVSERQAMRLTSYEDRSANQEQIFTLSPLSYFVGGGAMFNVNESEAFDGQFSVNADLVLNVLPTIKISNIEVNLPFRGNLSALIAQPNLNTEYQLGIYPFFQVPENRTGYDLIVHAGYEGKLNPDQEGFEESQRMTRLYLGAEASIYISENSKPVVIGVAPVWTNDFPVANLEDQDPERNSLGIEATAIFQVVDGFGLLARWYGPFSGPRQQGFQTGIVLIGANKGR